MKLNEVAIDVDRGENGAWVDDIPELQGLRLKVRSSQNNDWRKLLAKLTEAVPRKKRIGGRMDPEEMDKILSSCLLNCCLLDWEGLEDDDGLAIPFDKKMAQKLLVEPEYRRFRDGVLWAASIVGETVEAEREDVAGNLLTLSAGSASGERKSKAG